MMPQRVATDEPKASKVSPPQDAFLSLPASVENVEQRRGRHTVPEVHEALGCSNPLEATRLRRRDPATDREGSSGPIIILDPQDREPRRAPCYARDRCS